MTDLPKGARMITGTQDDLDLAITWLRGTLHAALGPERGEEELKKVPMYEAVALYLDASESPLEA